MGMMENIAALHMEAEKKLAIAIEALRFYAAKEAWNMMREINDEKTRMFLSMPMDMDKGKVARKALKEIEEIEK